MLEGLVISLIGMTVVFAILTILMFVIIILERILRTPEKAAVVTEVVAEVLPEQGVESHDIADLALIAAVTAGVASRRKRLRQQTEDVPHPPLVVVADEPGRPAKADGVGTIPPGRACSKSEATSQHSAAWRTVYPPLPKSQWRGQTWTGRR